MKRKTSLLTLLVIGLSLIVAAMPARAEDLQMVLNELKIVSVANLKRVAVGDPEIADISVLSNNELMLIAKKAGATSLIVWDNAGQQTYNITVIGEDLERLAQRIRGLLASSNLGTVRLKSEADKIYVLGAVASKNEFDKVQDVLTPFGDRVVNLVKLEEQQPLVEIAVSVLEIASDDLKNLGLDWSNSLPIKHSETSTNRSEKELADIWRVMSWDRTAIDARLNLLIQEDKARTLANPKLVTLSGKEASFLVGGEVPYVTVESEGRTTVEWRDYGIGLKILPVVAADNSIQTKIEAEVSDLDWANAVEQQDYRIPALKKRSAQTEILLNDGDTIVIGGLIKNEDSRNIDRLPWMSKVPILGELFKSTAFRDKRTELVISLTPRLIGPSAKPEDITSEMLKQEAVLGERAPAQENSALDFYTSLIEDIITRNVTYPDEAQRNLQEGVVEIEICLLADGHLQEAIIKQSSGLSLLDQAALAAVQEIAPYPSFPPQVTQKELRLTIPVVFKSYLKND